MTAGVIPVVNYYDLVAEKSRSSLFTTRVTALSRKRLYVMLTDTWRYSCRSLSQHLNVRDVTTQREHVLPIIVSSKQDTIDARFRREQAPDAGALDRWGRF